MTPLLGAIAAAGIPTWASDKAATEAWASALAAAYPNVDVAAEVLKCAAWWLANQNKTAGRKGCVRTITNWMKNARPIVKNALASDIPADPVAEARKPKKPCKKCKMVEATKDGYCWMHAEEVRA